MSHMRHSSFVFVVLVASCCGGCGQSRLASPQADAEASRTIRAAIADGSYETPEKLDMALDRLLERLGS